MLAHIRAALRDVPDHDVGAEEIDRRYRTTSLEARGALVELFNRRVAEYKGQVTFASGGTLGNAVREAAQRHGVVRVVAPHDLPSEWLGEWGEVERDGGGKSLPASDLDRVDAAITGCAAAIAETGTIILNGGTAQGRRAISLLPNVHICVVFEDQICGTVPEALSRVRESAIEGGRPVTLISGPSATSDIELNRVEGVHGPRVLEVVVAGGVISFK
jgi:L-lactate dehydrogenase complex protein LldG